MPFPYAFVLTSSCLQAVGVASVALGLLVTFQEKLVGHLQTIQSLAEHAGNTSRTYRFT